jgi:hypothetical protein
MIGTKPTHLGPIFCLIALLAQLILPLAHQCQCHLHALEECHASVALVAGQEVAPRLGAAESEEEHHHHDPATCPICQAAFRARDFIVPTVNLAPALSQPVQRFCHNFVTSEVANADILVSGPRAPPVSL